MKVIKAQKGKRTQVVHFDRLKPCTPRTWIAQRGGAEQQRSTTSDLCKTHVLGEQLNIESDDDEPPPPRDQQRLIEAPPPIAIEPDVSPSFLFEITATLNFPLECV